MAFFSCEYRSSALGKSTNINIIIPEGAEKGGKVLYLLHGHSDNNSAWMRFTSIERYAMALGIAVVMPDADVSFYSDVKYGLKYYTYISEELPSYIARTFRLSAKCEDTYIAGLSMGGYGALKIALSNPEKYAGAASLSGALDVAFRVNVIKQWTDVFYKICGDENLETSRHNLFNLVEEISDNPVKPKIYVVCGREDFLYRDNCNFDKFIAGKGFDYKFVIEPGIHNWDFWDKQIYPAIAFLLDKNG